MICIHNIFDSLLEFYSKDQGTSYLKSIQWAGRKILDDNSVLGYQSKRLSIRDLDANGPDC